MNSLILFKEVMLKTLVLVLFLLPLYGCERRVELSESQAIRIVEEARLLFAREGNVKFKYIELSEELYPVIFELKPEKLILREEGLYIRLNRGFATDDGFFVPRLEEEDQEFSPYGDPAFRLIFNSIYSYESKG